MTDRLNVLPKIGFGIVVLIAWTSLGAQEANRSRTEAQAKRAADRLQALQADAERMATEERTLLGELRKLELDREIAAEQLRQAASKAGIAAAQQAAVDEQVKRLELEQRSASPEVGRRIVELYKLGQARYLRLLLSTPDVRRLGGASRMVAALAARDRNRISTYQQRLDELNVSRATLTARAAELIALRAEAERAQQAASRAIATRSELIRRIDTERDLNAQLAGELQGAQQKLQITLRDLTSGAATREPAALPLRPFRGDLNWPVAGTIQRRFGQSAGARAALSNGIEIAAPEGTDVAAVHEGIVAFADSFTGFGRLVILDHGGQSFSLYGNLATIAVTRGARVGGGDRLGTVGAPATGETALYFELRIDGHAVDPLQWLKGR